MAEVLIRQRVADLAKAFRANMIGTAAAQHQCTRERQCPARADRPRLHERDARHLARLPHLGEIVAVAIPSIEQEAARDLVRAREDCRGDLMTARHRLSKLLLRQGIVYYGGAAWTGKHELWLRTYRFGPATSRTAATAATYAPTSTARPPRGRDWNDRRLCLADPESQAERSRTRAGHPGGG